MDNGIATQVWHKQERWSVAAGALKAAITRWRSRVLALAIAGAFVETLSTQLAEGPARVLAWAGAAMLAVIPIVTPRMLSAEKTKAWVRARSVSEGLKSESYAFSARAEPYAGPPDAATETLRQRALEIERAATDLSKHLPDELVETAPPGSLSPRDYLERRVDDQIRWYRRKAKLSARTASRFRGIELGLAVGAAVVGAAAAVWGGAVGIWVAVLTTIGTTLTAHIAAARYDHLESSYSATALQLENLKTEWPTAGGAAAPSEEWSRFVRRCEDAISKENQSWMAKRSKAGLQ